MIVSLSVREEYLWPRSSSPARKAARPARTNRPRPKALSLHSRETKTELLIEDDACPRRSIRRRELAVAHRSPYRVVLKLRQTEHWFRARERNENGRRDRVLL